MPPGRKQGGGCWTCRLRRKGCDCAQPVCGSCQSLGIACHSGAVRPAWMDGGSQQKLMSETIRAAIKQNALVRRERRPLAREEYGTIMAMETNDAPERLVASAAALASDPASRVTAPIAHYDASGESTASTPSENFRTRTTLQSSVDRMNESQSPLTVSSWASSPATLLSGCSENSSQPAAPIHVSLGSVMIYLDYVFPFLFPFYQPSLLETGRQWLLGLLCQNDVSFHLASSLSAYFFSLVPQSDEQDMHDDCKTLVWDKLIEQMDLAIGSIQSTVSAVSNPGSQSPLLERIRIMQEIAQLLIVEVTVRNHVDWTMHLTPALSILDEIFETHGLNHASEPSLHVLANALPSSIPLTTQHHKALPNTADQSALTFFVSVLLFVDIIASTSLGTRPTLERYHGNLLSTPGNESFRIRLESVVGCQNWVLVALGKVSALCEWKRNAKQNGNFSVFDLVKLADPISRDLEKGLKDLDKVLNSVGRDPTRGSRIEAYYSRHDRTIDHHFTANITRIWAHAAMIYLSVSLSGWQRNSRDIQASIAQILHLVNMMDSPSQLQSLSWPICIAGCLASAAQESSFQRIISTTGSLGKFGTLSNALGIMEAVWASRDTIDDSSWDVASSLRLFGSPVLLI